MFDAMSIVARSQWIFGWVVVAYFLASQPELSADDERPAILAHYMPWYSSKPVSGRWGWHWTMDHFNPDRVGKNGQRDIASHDYPLIGPYDSVDPYVLEYHVLQMKFSGIDGVIVDWYGIEDFREYETIHRNTQHLFGYIRKAGLKFAVCYEDRTIGAMVDAKKLQPDEAVSHAAGVLKWLDKNWFREEVYIKQDNRPILPVFGPIYFGKPEQWDEIFSGLSSRPVLFALPHLSKRSGAEGAFCWPPVSGGKEIAPTVWRKYLTDLYTREAGGESIVGVAFPGFHDVYAEAGLHASYGYINDRDGKTFEETLELALKSNSQLIQIATWNDFGEGTVIEPSQRFGYRYLEELQNHARPPTRFTPEDLRLPLILYQLRKSESKNAFSMKELERASVLMFASKCAEARVVLESLLASGEQDYQPATAPESKSEREDKAKPESKVRPQ